MLLRSILFAIVIALALPGCTSPEKKKKKEEKKEEKEKEKEKKKSTIPDASADVTFQSFVGRLRIAVQRKDRAVIASMMDSNFGWRWDTPPPGETAFDYWDKNNLWGELSTLLNSRFVPNESYMVSPPQFVTDSSYRGYRMGLRQANGSWRFSYFITGEDILQ